MTFNRVDGVIYQKIELFITTAARTSNPTVVIQLFYLNDSQQKVHYNMGELYRYIKLKLRLNTRVKIKF
jgi:hypothetical protein